MDLEQLLDHLTLHGSICFLVGLFTGFPYYRSLLKEEEAELQNSWRVAHLSLTLGGVLLFSLVGLFPRISVGNPVDTLLIGSFILSAYSFMISLPLGALTKNRGLIPSKGWGQLVFLGNISGVLTSSVGGILLLYVSFLKIIK